MIKLSHEHSLACVEIKDTGIGIDPELIPVLFNPFKQIDSKMNRNFGGLGIGLALAKYLLEAQDGKIKLESEGISKGSRVYVYLPELMKSIS